MHIRDRIKELRRVPASDLIPNPKNWRTHPDNQRGALRGMLAEVGIADAVLARETPDGLQLIDGHLRTEELGAADVEIPVLILDVDEAEADKLLATFDPVAELAGCDSDKFEVILRDIQTGSQDVAAMLDKLAVKNGILPGGDVGEAGHEPAESSVQPTFQVAVECDDEADQQELHERLTHEGRRCRKLTL